MRVKKLLQIPGIDVNIQNKWGYAALIKACESGYLEIVNALLKIPTIDVNITTNLGNTALTLACYSGHYKVVNALLKIPTINVNIQNKSGCTAFFYLARLIDHQSIEVSNCNIDYAKYDIIRLITNEYALYKIINQIELKHQHNYNKIKTDIYQKYNYDDYGSYINTGANSIDLHPYFVTQRAQLNNILTTYIKQNRYMIDSYCTNLIFDYLYC